MANRKPYCQRNDFAAKLERMGFQQIGDATFVRGRIKIFRTNKTNSDRVRYWEIREISTDTIFYRSNHSQEVIDYLSCTQFLTSGATMAVKIER